MDVDKDKTKRKYFVGQELDFRRDHMEVTAHSRVFFPHDFVNYFLLVLSPPH
jgi:hypothetical protein